jgi:hypothetical protein
MYPASQIAAPATGQLKLGDLPGPDDATKIEVVLRADEEGGTLVDLVECSWGSGIGWYAQKRVTLRAEQVEALRGLLGSSEPEPPRLRAQPPRVERDGNVLRLLNFD